MGGPKETAGHIAWLCKELKTPIIAGTFTGLAEQARAEGWAFEGYLNAVLGRQVASRTANGARPRVAGAHSPQVKPLEDFDTTVRLGPPGTGKAHLAIALGIAACHAGCSVAVNSATGWIRRLAAHDTGGLDRELRRLHRTGP